MRIVGVDPGTKGAMAVLEDGVLVSTANASSKSLDMPHDLLELLRTADLAVIERPVAFPGIPAQSQMVLAAGYGMAVALARLAGVRLVVPTPGQWKKALGVTSDKATAQRAAHELLGLPETTRDDLCEAALLAWYGHRHGHGAPDDTSLASKKPKKPRKTAPRKRKTNVATPENSD